MTQHTGNGFELRVTSNGEDFSKKNDRMEDLIAENHVIMDTNPNQYEVLVVIMIAIK